MPAPLRFSAFLLALLLAVARSAAAPLDVVTFGLRTDGEDQKLIVTPSPTLLRVDVPRDGYSIIYNPQTQFYLGLENRNYTYWQFSWPEVRASVAGTKRYETRLREVGSSSLSGSSAPGPDPALPGGGVTVPPLDTNIPGVTAPAAAASTTSDDSGYVWRLTTDKKRITGLDCVRWTGESLSGGPVEAWCYSGALPKVQAALTGLRAINEPIALVPVRNLVPPFVFEVVDALGRGGAIPLLISWGDEQDRNHFELLGLKTREDQENLFTVPKLYVKTTLITMDGIGSQKPQEAIPREGAPARREHLPSP